MRLLFPSFFIAVYVYLSIVRPLSVRLPWKIALGLAILAVGQKYLFYQFLGGSFFKPELPLGVLIAAEALYASLVVLFFSAALKDFIGLVFWLARRGGFGLFLPFSPGMRCSVLVAASLMAGIWGSIEAVRVPDIRTVEVSIPSLPQALEGFSIVQLTDVHIGPMFKGGWLGKVVEKANSASPDIVVITGDVIDGLPHELAHEVAPLAKLRAKHGVFAVTGNHECYYDAEGWKKVFRSMGIEVLENEHRSIPGGLVLGGVPDRTEQRFGGQAPEVSKTFHGAPGGPRVLLSHQPRNGDDIPARGVHLQLSGHTHGGLLFFLAPLIAHYNAGYVSGLYDTGHGQLYVSRGTGLWNGFSCRIGVPSEITRIILTRQP